MAVKFSSKSEMIEKLRKQINEKDSTAINTLMFVFAHQTNDEQIQDNVKYHNGMGFKPQDAERGSSFAKWYKDKGFFTAKQMNCIKRMVIKYAGQVVEFKIVSGEIRHVGRGEWIWGCREYCEVGERIVLK
jgi:hypothetical protein